MYLLNINWYVQASILEVTYCKLCVLTNIHLSPKIYIDSANLLLFLYQIYIHTYVRILGTFESIPQLEFLIPFIYVLLVLFVA